jgi:hypothetical protein
MAPKPKMSSQNKDLVTFMTIKPKIHRPKVCILLVSDKCSEWKFRSFGLGQLLKSERRINRQKNVRRHIDIVHIDKCPHEIQEQKEVPVRYIGIYRPVLSTAPD